MNLSLKNIPPFTQAPADEEELPMLEVTSHINDKLNLTEALRVTVVKNGIPDQVNGGVLNDVRIKK